MFVISQNFNEMRKDDLNFFNCEKNMSFMFLFPKISHIQKVLEVKKTSVDSEA